jgi:hypothetical protein
MFGFEWLLMRTFLIGGAAAATQWYCWWKANRWKPTG